MTITKYNVPVEIEKKILTAIELKKELEKYESEIKEALKDAMIENDVYSIKNEKYTITLATRASYKEDGFLPADFQKIVMDTKKVGDYEKLYGEVPKGVKKTETKYVTWRAK